VLRLLGVGWRWSQHLHSTSLTQSLPKTFSAHYALPLVVDLASAMELSLNDPIAASIWSS
jgi:hypothetical protein